MAEPDLDNSGQPFGGLPDYPFKSIQGICHHPQIPNRLTHQQVHMEWT